MEIKSICIINHITPREEIQEITLIKNSTETNYFMISIKKDIQTIMLSKTLKKWMIINYNYNVTDNNLN